VSAWTPVSTAESYAQAESLYVDWHHRFVVHLGALRPALQPPRLVRLADAWYEKAAHLTPEHAAELALAKGLAG
jgi:hypothetical protein